MSENQKMVKIATVLKEPVPQKQERPTVYRYEIFKGERDQDGKIQKKKVVGSAYHREGLKTYTVHLKTFLNDTFYLLPNTRGAEDANFIILTREPGQNVNRKYFWNNVGEARILDGHNSGIMQLSWDMFAQDLFMNLYPINVTEKAEATLAEVAA